MFKRVKTCKFNPICPTKQNKEQNQSQNQENENENVCESFLDMEQSSLTEKLQFLRERSTLKCMNKNEMLEEHQETWRSNGLSSLNYKELYLVKIGDNDNACSKKVTVDILLNDHWSDLVCTNDSQQMDLPPNEAKTKWTQKKEGEKIQRQKWYEKQSQSQSGSTTSTNSMSVSSNNGAAWTIEGQNHWTKEDYQEQLRRLNQSMREH